MKNRSIRVEYLIKNDAGQNVFAVAFIEGNRCMGEWPTPGGDHMMELITNWILDGRRPQ